MSKKNDSDFIYNEAKVADGKDVLASIRHDIIEVDQFLYNTMMSIGGAKGIENILTEDYTIDLKQPEKLMEQSRDDLKTIMQTLDNNIDMIDRFMNPQDSNVKTPIGNENGNNNGNIENENKDQTYTKEQIINNDLTEETPEEDVTSINEKITTNDPSQEATIKVINDQKQQTVCIYGPPSMMDTNNTPTDIPTDVPTNDTPTDSVVSIGSNQQTVCIYGPPSSFGLEDTHVVNPTPVVTPTQPVNPVVSEPVVATPVEVQNNPSTNVVNTPTTTTTSGENTSTTSGTTSTSTKISTGKVGSTLNSNLTSKNASVVPSSTSRDTQTENRVKTDTKKESYTATRHDGMDKKVIAGAIGGAALLGAVGIGVPASATKKKERDTDENFDGSSYTPTTDNYNPN